MKMVKICDDENHNKGAPGRAMRNVALVTVINNNQNKLRPLRKNAIPDIPIPMGLEDTRVIRKTVVICLIIFNRVMQESV